ncbi:unnamed protein product [Clavelina lepadiformis]|uniref:Protein kinase domain-containing protein n=1 Tax=Clavelina lepadiformis TaxID=159417 RepID=A0ABP0GT18_CLALP
MSGKCKYYITDEESDAIDNRGYSVCTETALGTGQFGRVFKAQPCEVKIESTEKLSYLKGASQQLVAIKIIYVDVGFGKLKRLAKLLTQEIGVMHECFGSKYLVNLIEVFADNKRVFLVMEYAEGGSLDEKLDEILEEEDVEGTVHPFFRDLVKAILYIHGRGIAHRDLNLSNLLLTKDDTVKLADFGLATKQLFDQSGMMVPHTTACGMLTYAAPELLIGKQAEPYNACYSDLWSLGVVLYLLIHGKFAFDGKSRETLAKSWKKYFRNPSSLKFKEGLSEPCKDLILKLLKKDPNERLSPTEILQHRWIENGAKGKPAAEEIAEIRKLGKEADHIIANPDFTQLMVIVLFAEYKAEVEYIRSYLLQRSIILKEVFQHYTNDGVPVHQLELARLVIPALQSDVIVGNVRDQFWRFKPTPRMAKKGITEFSDKLPKDVIILRNVSKFNEWKEQDEENLMAWNTIKLMPKRKRSLKTPPPAPEKAVLEEERNTKESDCASERPVSEVSLEKQDEVEMKWEPIATPSERGDRSTVIDIEKNYFTRRNPSTTCLGTNEESSKEGERKIYGEGECVETKQHNKVISKNQTSSNQPTSAESPKIVDKNLDGRNSLCDQFSSGHPISISSLIKKDFNDLTLRELDEYNKWIRLLDEQNAELVTKFQEKIDQINFRKMATLKDCICTDDSPEKIKMFLKKLLMPPATPPPSLISFDESDHDTHAPKQILSDATSDICNVNPSLTKMEQTTDIKLDDNKKECGEDRTNADRAQGNIESRYLVKTEQEPIKQISTLQSSSNTAVTPLDIPKMLTAEQRRDHRVATMPKVMYVFVETLPDTTHVVNNLSRDCKTAPPHGNRYRHIKIPNNMLPTIYEAVVTYPSTDNDEIQQENTNCQGTVSPAELHTESPPGTNSEGE